MAEVVLSLPDATVRHYTRSFDSLAIELKLWDETARALRAEGVSRLEDDGTHECDALVRVLELDGDNEALGYEIADVEGKITMRFRARRIDFDA